MKLMLMAEKDPPNEENRRRGLKFMKLYLWLCGEKAKEKMFCGVNE